MGARPAGGRDALRSVLRRPSLWALLVVLAGAALYLALRAAGPTVRTGLATRSRLEQHVVASGRVWVPTRVEVSAQTPGLVVAVGVAEGERVKPGDLLVQLDDAEARAAVAQARAAVSQASARVDQLQRVGAIVATEALRQARTNLERAEDDYERAQKLAATGSIPRTDLDTARRAVDLARAQSSAAEAQQLSSTPMGADTRIALTALLQAQAQLAGANVRLAQTRIVALQDGVVLTRSVEPGDVVQPSRTLLVVAAGGSTQLVFQADERNLAAMKLGQRARASADAFPDQVFDAVVSYVAPSIDPQRGSVEVRLVADRAPSVLMPDMTVSIDITVATKPDALAVPSEAVHAAASPAPWVLAVEEGRIVRRDVRLGIRGDGATEIAAGLADGAEVVLPDGPPPAPGERVRPSRGER